MSRATDVLNALKAEELLKGSYVLTLIEKLHTSLQYGTNGQTVSFDDYYLSLQKEVDEIPRLELGSVVATGTENQYILQLISAMEKVQDDSGRIGQKVAHFQSKLHNALGQIKKLNAAFNAWYTLAANEALSENGAKFPANQLKDLAASEFSRLMQNSDVEVESLLEAVKVQGEQIKQYKKTQQAKFELGKDQANASWTSGLPNFGEAPDRADQLLAKQFVEEDEPDEEVPAFISKKPQIGGETGTVLAVDEFTTPKQFVDEGLVTETYNEGEIKGTFFKRSDAKPITPIVADDGQAPVIQIPSDTAGATIDKAAPLIWQPAPTPPVKVEVPKPIVEETKYPAGTVESFSAIFPGAKEVVLSSEEQTINAISPKTVTLPKPPKTDKVALTFIAPLATDQVVTRIEATQPEKIHCGVCHRRIRVNQTMFQRADGDAKEYFHAVEAECSAKPPVVHNVKTDDVPAPITQPLQVTPAKTETPVAGSLLDVMEKGASKSIPIENVTQGVLVDVPPVTQPLETAAVTTVDAPATPRKRLTFLDEDEAIA